MLDSMVPCSQSSETAQIVTAVGAVVTTCLTLFLARRRVVADRTASTHRVREEALQAVLSRKVDDIHAEVSKNGSDGL